jgi:hypothetical protein
MRDETELRPERRGPREHVRKSAQAAAAGRDSESLTLSAKTLLTPNRT